MEEEKVVRGCGGGEGCEGGCGGGEGCEGVCGGGEGCIHGYVERGHLWPIPRLLGSRAPVWG